MGRFDDSGLLCSVSFFECCLEKAHGLLNSVQFQCWKVCLRPTVVLKVTVDAQTYVVWAYCNLYPSRHMTCARYTGVP